MNVIIDDTPMPAEELVALDAHQKMTPAQQQDAHDECDVAADAFMARPSGRAYLAWSDAALKCCRLSDRQDGFIISYTGGRWRCMDVFGRRSA